MLNKSRMVSVLLLSFPKIFLYEKTTFYFNGLGAVNVL